MQPGLVFFPCPVVTPVRIFLKCHWLGSIVIFCLPFFESDAGEVHAGRGMPFLSTRKRRILYKNSSQDLLNNVLSWLHFCQGFLFLIEVESEIAHLYFSKTCTTITRGNELSVLGLEAHLCVHAEVVCTRRVRHLSKSTPCA